MIKKQQTHIFEFFGVARSMKSTTLDICYERLKEELFNDGYNVRVISEINKDAHFTLNRCKPKFHYPAYIISNLITKYIEYEHGVPRDTIVLVDRGLIDHLVWTNVYYEDAPEEEKRYYKSSVDMTMNFVPLTSKAFLFTRPPA